MSTLNAMVANTSAALRRERRKPSSTTKITSALKPARDALPMAVRSREESRIFRVAMRSGGAAAVGAAAAVPAAWAGLDVRLLADTVRHLITVGVLTSMVVAMAFRLIPVLEGRALPWPRLRQVALWSLATGIVLRSAEVLVGAGWPAVAPGVALSGILIWIAVACVGANLVAVIGNRSRGVEVARVSVGTGA